jgi:hypothetical protein
MTCSWAETLEVTPVTSRMKNPERALGVICRKGFCASSPVPGTSHLVSNISISKISVALGGIFGGLPRSP